MTAAARRINVDGRDEGDFPSIRESASKAADIRNWELSVILGRGYSQLGIVRHPRDPFGGLAEWTKQARATPIVKLHRSTSPATMTDMARGSNQQIRKRCPLRSSIRTMLIIVLALSIWLGWMANRAAKQRNAVKLVKELGGYVVYECEIVESPPSV